MLNHNTDSNPSISVECQPREQKASISNLVSARSVKKKAQDNEKVRQI